MSNAVLIFIGGVCLGVIIGYMMRDFVTFSRRENGDDR